MTLAPISAAHAATDPYIIEPPTIPPVSIVRDATLQRFPRAPSDAGDSRDPGVRTASISRGESAGGGLAVTGTDVLPLTVIGLGALGVGTVLVLKNRRRQED